MNKLKQMRKDKKAKDKVWALLVKTRDNNCCVICNSNLKPNAHHLIPRENHLLRWEVDNGVTLCPKHHRFSFELSAHQNPLAFFIWLKRNKQEQLNKLLTKYFGEEYGEGKDN